MSDDLSVGPVGSLRHLGPTARLLRLCILVMPLVALAATAHAGTTAPLLSMILLAMAAACAITPDSHLGLLVLVLLAVHWLAVVDDPGTGWAVMMAVALLMFHVSLAAATVAPPAARWTSAMHRRWGVRTAVVVATAGGTWITARGFAAADATGSAPLLGAALVALVIAGLWVRARSLPSR